MNPVIYTAAIDNRFGVGKVSSRIGLEEEAYLFRESSNLFEEVDQLHQQMKVDCILVDECQFLSKEQVYQLTDVVDRLGIPVLCYGLRSDFKGELFPGSQHLLAWADKLVELKTICHCGKKANMVVRVDAQGQPIAEGAQVDIGGNDRYVSVCRKHYKEALGRL